MTKQQAGKSPPIPAPEGLEVELVERDGAAYAVLRFPSRSTGATPRLTTAEREVLADLLQGLKTRDIANRRGTSPRTVSNQIAGIFRAYGVASRGELFARCRGIPHRSD